MSVRGWSEARSAERLVEWLVSGDNPEFPGVKKVLVVGYSAGANVALHLG